MKRRALELIPGPLTEGQRDYLHSELNWLRLAFKRLQLLSPSSPHGIWELSELGARFARAHRDEALVALNDVPNARPGPAQVKPQETVEVTDTAAYEVLVLRTLGRFGAIHWQRVADSVLELFGDSLLPGDRRRLPGGEQVFAHRVWRSLTQLRALRQVHSPLRATYEITAAGRARLETEEASFQLSNYQRGSKTSVLMQNSVEPAPLEPELNWDSLSEAWGWERIEAIRQRLRPELGPLPVGARPQRNLILYGPPGTGKTFLAKQLAQTLTGDAQPGQDFRWRLVQFHPSYSYEDFVQGLRPDLNATGIRYQLCQGPFLEACRAAENSDQFHVLVIDEINRGDPARIFGEGLYALEYRGEGVDLALQGRLVVPPNLVIIGTMNSVDRSVALVDYALRRRFSFIRLRPDPELLARRPVAGASAAAAVLAGFNDWLAQQLDEEHAVGHSFFFTSDQLDAEDLDRIWRCDVLPLLEEYFFGDRQRLLEAGAVWRAAVASANGDE